MGALYRSFHRSASISLRIFLLAFLFITANAAAVMPPEQADESVQSLVQLDLPNKAGPRYKSGEILVKLREGVTVANPTALAAMLGVARGENFRAPRKGRGPAAERLKRWWRVELPPGIKVEAAIARLEKHPDVEFAEPNYLLTVDAVPNDSRYSEMWALDNYGQTGGTVDADIDAAEAWDVETGSSDVIVAVLDTGIDYTHEDLAANMWVNQGEIPGNGIDDDGNGYIDDIHGYDFEERDADPFDRSDWHGTHVAGIIAAVGNNGIGITGVSWNARIMALKVFGSNDPAHDPTPDTDPDPTFSADLYHHNEAISYAIDMGAKVINASTQLYDNDAEDFIDSHFDDDAILAANEANILIARSAGNSGNELNDTNCPGCFEDPNVIGVAATDDDDKLYSSSTYGVTKIHLGAPGTQILSTIPYNQYELSSGTSMAAPHVAGAAALILGRSPGLSVQDVKALLLDSVDPLPDLADKTISGGRLNINNALALLDYEVAFNPSVKEALNDGKSTDFTLTLTSVNNFSDALNLSLESLAPGLSGTLSDTAISLQPNGTASITVTVTTTKGMAGGYYPVRISMTDSSGKATIAEATLHVIEPGFSIHINPTTQLVGLNGSVDYEVVVDSIDGFSGKVSLSAAGSDPSLSTTVTSSVTVLSNRSVGAVLTVTASPTTPLQTHTVSVTAKSGNTIISASTEVKVIDVDLVPTYVMPSISTALSGVNTTMTISDIVQNFGSMTTTSGFVVGHYLSIDDTIDETDTRIGYRYISNLYSGSSSSGSTSVTIPSTLPAGDYYVGTFVDFYKLHPESNENNNGLASLQQITVIPSDMDLVMTDATFDSGSTAYIGFSFPVTETVMNQGSLGRTPGSHVAYYLSNDNSLDGADIFLYELTLGSINPGVTQQRSYNINIPATTPTGTFTLLAVVDSQNEVTETNEDNNVYPAGNITIETTDIDLVVSTVTLDPPETTLYLGSIHPVVATITNIGTTSYDLDTTISYYLSSDTEFQTTDTGLTGNYFSGLPAGSSTNVSSTLRPFYLDEGDYYLLAVVDTSNRVVESNEDNNVKVIGPVALKASDMDLTVQDVTAPCGTVVLGSSFSITDTIVNQGTLGTTTSFNVSYKLSSDGNFSWVNPTTIGTRYSLEGLAPGATVTETTTVTVPDTLAVGDYHLGVVISKGYETNLDNNVADVCQVSVVEQSASGVEASVTAGFNQTYEIRNDGTLWDWGLNSRGELGDGTTTDSHIPIQLGTDTDWTTVLGGSYHTVALKGGAIWTWGSNSWGQLGDGTTTERHSPVQVGTDTDWVSISAGYTYTVALKSNGTLWGWGNNQNGQLGEGTTIEWHTPVQVGTDTDWVAVSAGGYRTIALKSNGTLWGWGGNDLGQLGDGTTIERHAPVQLGTDTDWASISAGHLHALALKSNGTLWGWGWNGSGSVGDGTTISRYSPVQAGTDSDWVSVSAGGYHSGAVKSNGSIWTWGNNAQGELGDGTTTDSYSPIQVGTDTDWVSVSAGGYHTAGLKSDNTVWTWGKNLSGQLGDGTTVARYTPVQVQ